MSEKYQRPDHIRVVKAVCVEFGNNDDTWTWCYLDVREALTKAKELLMKLEPDDRLVIGTAYCGRITPIDSAEAPVGWVPIPKARSLWNRACV